MKLIEGFDSNYRYILVAARRARQLQSGAPPVVQTNSRKPCRIAQDEIRAGKVKWEIPETRSAAEQAVAARRARQLQSGAPPVVQTNSRKPCRIAQDEIRAGKVKWEIPETRSAAEQAAEVLDQAFGHDA